MFVRVKHDSAPLAKTGAETERGSKAPRAEPLRLDLINTPCFYSFRPDSGLALSFGGAFQMPTKLLVLFSKTGHIISNSVNVSGSLCFATAGDLI